MKGRFWKQTAAACLALLIMAGGMPVLPAAQVFEKIAVTASAYEVGDVLKPTEDEPIVITPEDDLYYIDIDGDVRMLSAGTEYTLELDGICYSVFTELWYGKTWQGDLCFKADTANGFRIESGDGTEVFPFVFRDVDAVTSSIVIPADSSKGSVFCDRETAKFGDLVKLTVLPAENCYVKRVTVNEDRIWPSDDENQTVYEFPMPNQTAEVVVEYGDLLDPISYIDADGTEKSSRLYTYLTGNEPVEDGCIWLDGGTYIVDGTVSYDHELYFDDDSTLILKDGAELNIAVEDGQGIFASEDLTVFAQSSGANAGKMTVISENGNGIRIDDTVLLINGGEITVTGRGDDCDGISAVETVVVNGGTVYAEGDEAGISATEIGITVNGGEVYAKGERALFSDNGNITVNGGNVTAEASGANGLGLFTDDEGIYLNGGTLHTNAEIKASDGIILAGSTVQASGRLTADFVKVAEGFIYTDGTNTYTGILTEEETAALSEKTLIPDLLAAVSYIDENGCTVTTDRYTPLTEKTVSHPGGTYVVDGTVNYADTLVFEGDAVIILKDGALLNIDVPELPGALSADGDITVYAQEAGTGALHVSAMYKTIDCNNYRQYGGKLRTESEYSIAAYLKESGLFRNTEVTAESKQVHALYCQGSLTLENSHVTAKGNINGCCVFGDLTVNGSYLNAFAEEYAAIDITKSVIISNGAEIIAKSNKNIALYSRERSILIEDSTVTAEGDTIGISAYNNTNGNIELINSSVTAHSNKNNAVAGAGVTVKGGTLLATSESDYNAAIYASDSVAFSDGAEVTAESSNNKGIVSSDISVTDSTVKVNSDEYGMYATGGDITLTNSHVTVTSTGISLNAASDISISDSYVTANRFSGNVILAENETYTDGTNTYTGTLTELEKESFLDKTLRPVAEEEEPGFRSHSLVLEGEIGVRFYVSVPEALTDGAFMTFTVNGCETTEKLSRARTRKVNGKRYYYCTCYVTSLEMADDITAVLTYGDGETLSNVYSVKQYVEDSAQENFDETTRALINAIADYGSYVQPFLAKAHSISEYNAMPAQTELTDADIAAAKAALADYQLVKGENQSDILNIGYSLNLKSRTTLRIALQLPAKYAGAVSAKMNGNNLPIQKNGSVYTVRIEDIAAHELGKPYEITFTTESGSWTVKVSALTYAGKEFSAPANVYAEKAMTALYNYFAATAAYRAALNA